MKSEAKVQNEIRLALGQRPDVVLFRNECGVASYERGGKTYTVRYGLSKGSADLIGVRTVRQACPCCGHEGSSVGQFLAVEVKAERGGRVGSHQQKWLDLIKKYGGVSGVARSVEEALEIVDEQ